MERASKHKPFWSWCCVKMFSARSQQGLPLTLWLSFKIPVSTVLVSDTSFKYFSFGQNYKFQFWQRVCVQIKIIYNLRFYYWRHVQLVHCNPRWDSILRSLVKPAFFFCALDLILEAWWHSGTVSSQPEGTGFNSWSRTFLCGVRIFLSVST